ncbi:reverse transcriptase domain-containing protein [Tanacetum coccineum]
MAYHDKYKKVLDEIWKEKVELDGMIMKEEEEAIKKVKGEALKEKDDPGAFIFPIRLECQVNENALADTGSDINTMPYQIYEQLGREEMKKVNKEITMINHTQAEAMGILTNVLCQVGVTTLIAKFLILDIPINRDALIVVGRGFLRTISGIVNTLERLFSTFDGFCHQTFRAARSDIMRNAESDSDDEEEYEIKRNKFGAPIYGLKPTPYMNSTVHFKETMGENDVEAESSRSKCSRQFETIEEVLLTQVDHDFLLREVNWDVLNGMGCDGEIDDMLRIKLHEAESNEEIFTFVAWTRAFNIKEPICVELCYELGLYYADELEEDGFDVYFQGDLHSDEHFNAQEYWTTRYDKIQKNDLWLLSMFDARHQNGYANVTWLIARFVYDYTERELINSEGRLILEDLQPGVPIVGIPRPPRASMQDLYNRMDSMEIRKEAIERMEYRHTPGYAQPQYDQYCKQHPPPPPQYPLQYQQQQDDDE